MLREVSPELAGDKQLMLATFGSDAEQQAATAKALRTGEEQIVRALTRAGVAIQQARQVANHATRAVAGTTEIRGVIGSFTGYL